MTTTLAPSEQTLDRQIATGAPTPMVDREALARRIAEAVETAFAKLDEHKADIELLWVEFDALTGDDTIMGCRTKTEFCETVLHRSYRAVRYMLTGGNPRNKKPRHESISRPGEVPETKVPAEATVQNEDADPDRIVITTMNFLNDALSSGCLTRELNERAGMLLLRWKSRQVDCMTEARHVDESKPAHDAFKTTAVENAPTRMEHAQVREAGAVR